MNRLKDGGTLLLPLAVGFLLMAAWAGLVRLGWGWPLSPRLASIHGPLVVCGFLGTVISLERAVALGCGWSYAAPALAAAGTLALVGGVPGVAAGLLILAAAVLTAVYGAAYRRQPASFTIVMGMGAVSWLMGNALYAAGRPLYQVVLWWMGFLVLTIVGERLELSRMRPPSRFGHAAFLGLVGAFLTALGASLAVPSGRLIGAALLGMSLWLWRNDVARMTIRQRGLPRFIAVALLLGYGWLMVAGILLMRFGIAPGGALYDAQLHAVFLGFVFSMIFAHAPIVLPALTGLTLGYRRRFYTHLVLLHASLAIRVAGDLLFSLPLRQWGGLINGVAILLFMLNTAAAVRAGIKKTLSVSAEKGDSEHPQGPYPFPSLEP